MVKDAPRTERESPERGTNYIGRYEIKARSGEGAFGIVYRAHDPLLDRTVAIKVPRADSLQTLEVQLVVEEFRHEAKVAGKFAHENVVTIYDVVSDSGLDYIVMEYVPGRSVQDYMIATGPLDAEEALGVVFKSCLGLAHMHHHGVIHRDVKPGNIMYHPAQGATKLMDFSVSHAIESPPARMTGSLGYMAPEHFDSNRRITFLTDIFALGATLYRLLTGAYPFDRTHTAFQVLHIDPTPIQKLRDDVPAAVCDLVSRAMAKADADRFPSALAFAEAIEGVLVQHYPCSSLLGMRVGHGFASSTHVKNG
jgi:eukaryotic-like serine/threonine-protein kinase